MAKPTYEELNAENKMLNSQVQELCELVRHMTKEHSEPDWRTNVGEKDFYFCAYRQIKEEIRSCYNSTIEIYRLQIQIVTEEHEADKRLVTIHFALLKLKEKLNCDFGEVEMYDNGDTIYCEVSSATPFIEEQEIPEPVTLILSKESKDWLKKNLHNKEGN